MADIDTAAIRTKRDFVARAQDADALCDEVDGLRARLAEVEAERDARPTWDQHRIWRDALRRENERRKAVEAERDLDRERVEWSRKAEYNERARALAAEARLAAVEALCDVDDGDVVTRREVLAAARGEGDRG